MDRTNLLPIGQFAQASGLSVTALRHYDASGVLTPAFVDPESGYRYFRRERRLDVQRSVVHGLLTRMTEGAGMNHRVTLRQGGPERVLVRAATVNHHRLDAFLRSAYEEMYAVAGRGPLTLTGPAFVRYHGLCDEENETLVEACLPFWESGAQPEGPGEGLSVRDDPECTYACTVVEGAATAFPEILTAYDAVANWIAGHGFAFAGPVRATFLRWTGTPDHPDNRLEIAWPVSEPAAEPAPEPEPEPEPVPEPVPGPAAEPAPE
ncbi:MerR family DNA-binding transcriptional regulator [Streptomyces sp. NPDC017254]|uniref:MerR family transcriptional regulator n=1 Tax=unclassified Streptomyces TaxID=2593676 RepID=UPI00379A8A04